MFATACRSACQHGSSTTTAILQVQLDGCQTLKCLPACAYKCQRKCKCSIKMPTQMQMLNQNANAQCSQVSPHNAPMPMQNARICIAMLRCQKAKWSKVIANANAAASNPKLKYQSKAKCKMLKYPLQNCQNANAKHSLTCQLHCSTLSTLKCLNVKK